MDWKSMDWKSEEEKNIKRYLLDDATVEERQRVEARLLEDDDYGELLLLIEGELIDNYASGAMDERERRLFLENFLLTPQRGEDLIIAREVVKLAAENEATIAQIMQESEMIAEDHPADNTTRRKRITEMRHERGWIRGLFSPGWKIATYAALALAGGLGYWLLQPDESGVATALSAMNQAYSAQRPLEARITDLNYAPFPKLLGGERGSVDYVALERAERILLDAVKQDPNAVTQHALGRLYLAQKKFDQAQNLFKAALQSAPNDARLHSDLGATLFEKWETEGAVGPSTESEELKRQSLEHLTKALTLDGSLREARFNLALLYQSANQTQLAREEWQKYLAGDPNSPWAEETKRNLAKLKQSRN